MWSLRSPLALTLILDALRDGKCPIYKYMCDALNLLSFFPCQTTLRSDVNAGLQQPHEAGSSAGFAVSNGHYRFSPLDTAHHTMSSYILCIVSR